eukprot:tig00020934_g16078.t1
MPRAAGRSLLLMLMLVRVDVLFRLVQQSMGSACCKRGAQDALAATPAKGAGGVGVLRVGSPQPRSPAPVPSHQPPKHAAPAAVDEKQREADSGAPVAVSDVAISLEAPPACAAASSDSKDPAPAYAATASDPPAVSESAKALEAAPPAAVVVAKSPAAASRSLAASPAPAAPSPAPAASAGPAASLPAPAPALSKGPPPAFAAGLEELRGLHSLEAASSLGQLAGLCGLLREARRSGAASEAASRARQVPLVAELYSGDVEAALCEAKEACFNALDAFAECERQRSEAIAEACAVVRSGDPELCFRLLEVLLRLRDGTVLEAVPLARVGALVDVLGRLPRGTLTSRQQNRLVAFCVQQLKDLGPRLAPGDVDALAALRLVPAVLAAFDSEGDGAAFAAADEEGGEAAEAAGRLDYEGTVRELDALLRGLEKCGWWRAEVAAGVARQALAAARSSYDPLQDAFARIKAAGRIVEKLYRVGKTVMESVGSFGVSTLIDLAVLVKARGAVLPSRGKLICSITALFDI